MWRPYYNLLDRHPPSEDPLSVQLLSPPTSIAKYHLISSPISSQVPPISILYSSLSADSISDRIEVHLTSPPSADPISQFYQRINDFRDIQFRQSINQFHHIINKFTRPHCSEKLHLQSYLENVWSATGYFGLLRNNHIFFIILLYIIEW